MEDAVAPAGDSAPEGSEAPPVAGGDAASAVPGNAPGDSGDVPAAGEAAGEIPSVPTPAEFVFNNRKFRDQKHAEEVYGTLDTDKRGLQRQNAERGQRVTQLEAEIAALRGMVPQQKGGGQEQAPKEAGSFAERLAKNGDLDFYASRAINAQGQITKEGLMETLFAFAQDVDKHQSDSLQKAMDDVRTGSTNIQTQLEQERTLARAYTAANALKSEFPELDDSNRADGIGDVHAEIFGLLKSGPPVMLENGNVVPQMLAWLASEPRQALRWAVEEYRRQHGTPVFAQSPGTSESPSAKAAAAAEKAAAGTVSTPPDGDGVPRQGSDKASTLEQRWRRESAQLPKEAKTPSGRSLGFPESL